MLRGRAADVRRLFVLSRAQDFTLPVLRMLLLSRIMVAAPLKEGGCEVENGKIYRLSLQVVSPLPG